MTRSAVRSPARREAASPSARSFSGCSIHQMPSRCASVRCPRPRSMSMPRDVRRRAAEDVLALDSPSAPFLTAAATDDGTKRTRVCPATRAAAVSVPGMSMPNSIVRLDFFCGSLASFQVIVAFADGLREAVVLGPRLGGVARRRGFSCASCRARSEAAKESAG